MMTQDDAAPDLTAEPAHTIAPPCAVAPAHAVVPAHIVMHPRTAAPAHAVASAHTVTESLQMAVHSLLGHSDSPRLDAELLLCKVLGLSRSGLIVRGAELVAVENVRTYDDLIARRMRGVPIAYLTGTREFWSLALTVTPDVLVPRPETEMLIERALELLPPDEERTVLDLGTGSGAIALAIAAERPLSRITGVDVSAQALAVAKANSHQLEPGRRLAPIDWRLGSWFEAVPGERFDMIVANPPYIASDDPALARLTAEPVLALVPGPTGLEALGKIIGRAARHLNPRGWLILEHGSTQADDVAQLLQHQGFRDIRSYVDYSGKPRITLGTVRSPN
jgi:release factor glutamine methyltransferase